MLTEYMTSIAFLQEGKIIFLETDFEYYSVRQHTNTYMSNSYVIFIQHAATRNVIMILKNTDQAGKLQIEI